MREHRSKPKKKHSRPESEELIRSYDSRQYHYRQSGWKILSLVLCIASFIFGASCLLMLWIWRRSIGPAALAEGSGNAPVWLTAMSGVGGIASGLVALLARMKARRKLYPTTLENWGCLVGYGATFGIFLSIAGIVLLDRIL